MLVQMLPAPLRPAWFLVAIATAAVVAACTSSPDESGSNTAGSTDAGSGGSGGTGGTGGSGGTGGTGTQSACDPLAPKAITLGEVVGAGKDAAGTIYVDSSNGIFVSDTGNLIRQHVIGTGQSGSNEYNFSFVAPGADYSTARNLLVETTGGKATAMALGPDGKTFLGGSTTGITMLTLGDPSTVSGMPLVNMPNVIAYVADVANGNVILATRPMGGDSTSSSGGLAIFYGPPTAVAQRVITEFQQSLSNSGTVTFLVDGTPYVLAFGMVSSPDGGPFGTFALQSLTPQGGSPIGVTLRVPTPNMVPSDLSVTCST